VDHVRIVTCGTKYLEDAEVGSSNTLLKRSNRKVNRSMPSSSSTLKPP